MTLIATFIDKELFAFSWTLVTIGHLILENFKPLKDDSQNEIYFALSSGMILLFVRYRKYWYRS